jgi:hypothetical protein
MAQVAEKQSAQGAGALPDLNLKPVADGSYDQATGALGFEGTLLLRMATQLDAIMRKLDAIEGAAEAREAKDEPRLRQWLKSLRSNPLKEPAPSHETSFEDLVDSPVGSITSGKPETNH